MEIFISGALDGRIRLYPSSISLSNEVLLAKPAEGYTITEEDVSHIEFNEYYNKSCSAALRDGEVWIVRRHIHKSVNGYTAIEGEMHSFICECGEMVTENCNFSWFTYDGEGHWTQCNHCDNKIN